MGFETLIQFQHFLGGWRIDAPQMRTIWCAEVIV